MCHSSVWLLIPGTPASFFCLVLGYVTLVRQGNLMDSGLIHAFIER